MRFPVAALLALAFALPAAGGAKLAATSWATGVITQVSASSIAVRGTVSLTLPNGSGGSARSTLDGDHLLTCDVRRAAVVAGDRAGTRVKIACASGVLATIARSR